MMDKGKGEGSWVKLAKAGYNINVATVGRYIYVNFVL